ncbi:MAG: Riboflavin biosynthesis protein RibBA [Myxococcota bacterium]|nr:Riboflavin biosynthesis protein RibBA [Myxococcota bacterium]
MISTIQEAIEDIRAGKMIILADDEGRENEGDLCMAAQAVTPEAVNFMARYGRGLICLTLTDERIRQLDLPMMVDNNESPYQTAFTVSIEARHGVTTGISAADRARTIQAAIAPEATPADLVRPGHVFPLRARKGGVLVRSGQTEGSVDLARLAGMFPAGVICEIMNDQGEMARMPELERFAQQHGLKIITIADLIRHRLGTEPLVRRSRTSPIQTAFGEFTLHSYDTLLDDHVQHLAFVKGDVTGGQPVLTRVHSESFFADVLHAADARAPGFFHESLRMVQNEGRGVVLYLRGPHRETELEHFLQSAREDKTGRGLMRHEMLMRNYGVGAQILFDLGLRRLRLITNNPQRLVALAGYNLEVAEHVPLSPPGIPARGDEKGTNA